MGENFLCLGRQISKCAPLLKYKNFQYKKFHLGNFSTVDYKNPKPQIKKFHFPTNFCTKIDTANQKAEFLCPFSDWLCF
jgi:hypothetical protein